MQRSVTDSAYSPVRSSPQSDERPTPVNYDLVNAARLALGRGLIAAGRTLSRAGAHLLRHPAAQPARPLRVVDPLAVVTAMRARPYRYRPEDTA